MSDVIDDYRALREFRREQKAKYGIDCPGCVARFPKRSPTRLLPGGRCRVCGFHDRRVPLEEEGK